MISLFAISTVNIRPALPQWQRALYHIFAFVIIIFSLPRQYAPAVLVSLNAPAFGTIHMSTTNQNYVNALRKPENSLDFTITRHQTQIIFSSQFASNDGARSLKIIQ